MMFVCPGVSLVQVIVDELENSQFEWIEGSRK